MKEIAVVVTISYILIFMLGVTVASLFYLIPDSDARLAQLSGDAAPEQLSPSDWISQDQIFVYDDEIVLDIKGATWSTFADTNSMDPLLDKQANGIEIKPKSPDQVNTGDVIAYQFEDSIIIHRVIEKGEDEDGTYFLAKGDNNVTPDPDKIRFEQIEGVLVAIVY